MDRSARAYWPLPLRIYIGIAFLVHGIPKLAGGEPSLAGMLAHLGVPAAAFFAWVVALVEVLGAISLIIGFLVPLSTVLLGIEMLVALFLVHLPHGFAFVQVKGMGPNGPIFGMPGVEVNLLYLSALLALLIGGPGPLSVVARVPRAERALRAPWWRERRAHA